jgi:hypothetical protein
VDEVFESDGPNYGHDGTASLDMLFSYLEQAVSKERDPGLRGTRTDQQLLDTISDHAVLGSY